MSAGSNSIILDDPEWPKPGFKVTVYFSKPVHFRDKVTKEHYTQSICYHFQWQWVTFDHDLKVTTFFDIEYLRNDTRYSHGFYKTSIGSRMRSIEYWYFQWPWRTLNPVFKVTAFLKSNIGKTACLKNKVSLLLHKRKLYL